MKIFDARGEVKPNEFANIVSWSSYRSAESYIKELKSFELYDIRGLPDAVPCQYAACGSEITVTEETLTISVMDLPALVPRTAMATIISPQVMIFLCL